ncbi:unnamed protein product [Lampetra planeri]
MVACYELMQLALMSSETSFTRIANAKRNSTPPTRAGASFLPGEMPTSGFASQLEQGPVGPRSRAAEYRLSVLREHGASGDGERQPEVPLTPTKRVVSLAGACTEVLAHTDEAVAPTACLCQPSSGATGVLESEAQGRLSLKRGYVVQRTQDGLARRARPDRPSMSLRLRECGPCLRGCAARPARHGAALHGTAPRHGTAWHGTARRYMARHGAALHGTAPRHGTALHGTARRYMARHGTAFHGTAPRHGTAWHGTALHGTARHGVSWHGSTAPRLGQYHRSRWRGNTPESWGLSSSEPLPGEDKSGRRNKTQKNLLAVQKARASRRPPPESTPRGWVEGGGAGGGVTGRAPRTANISRAVAGAVSTECRNPPPAATASAATANPSLRRRHSERREHRRHPAQCHRRKPLPPGTTTTVTTVIVIATKAIERHLHRRHFG